MEVGVFLAVLCLNIPFVVSQCTLPLADGDWISTSRGTWTVSGSGTQISNFQADLSGTVNTATMSCVATGSTTDQYILSTNFELFFQVFIDVYTCIEIVATERAPYSYTYYIVTATDTTTGETFTSDQTAACSNTEFKTGANLNILTQTATVGNASINFPDLILGNYSVVYTDKDGAEETDWTMDSCNNTELLNFGHATSTNNVGFTTTTAPNLLQCLYYLESGSDIYVFMYNNGTQDGSTSYSYTCWVFATSGTNVVATAFPNTCQDTQTSTSVIYGGEKYTFTPYFTCPLNASSEGDEDGGLAGWIIALIVLGLLLLIAIIIVTIIYCYMRKSRKEDEEKGFVKEGDRHPSPDSLRELDVDEEKKKAHAEYRASTFRKNKGDEYGKKLEKDDFKGKGREKERTLDLIEVSKDKSHKLQEVNPANDKIKPEGIVTPREISKPQEVVKTKEEIKQEKLEEKRKEEERRQEEKRERKRQEENRKKEEEALKKIKRAEEEEARKIKRAEEEDAKKIKRTEEEEARKKQEEALKKIIEPSGKTSIPPTTPKPELDETLLRIKKERERKEKEREDKRRHDEHRKKEDLRKDTKHEVKAEERVHKTVRETSSSEYETDESEQEERKQRFIEKRKRLAAASYEPIDGMLGDASVVGRKKHRKHRHFEDGGDTAGKMMSREENERQKEERRERKKRLKKMARRKIRGHEHPLTSDSETEHKGRKKRRAGDPRGVVAPYIEQYHQKKDIEQELDKSHYWDEPESLPMEEDALATPKPQANTTQAGARRADEDVLSPSKMEIIMQEEEYDPDVIRVGPDDALPDGYLFDKDGNIIRVSDGKTVMTQSQVEQRRKFGNVFSLPRLLRNEDGRPLGGYKDDEFGPTAEWDWGDQNEGNETDQDAAKSEIPARTVAFSMNEDLSTVPATPLDELDTNQRKGRQLGSADRELLRKRLFEKQQQQQQKQRAKHDHPPSVPIYFAGSKGGVKDSAFIENSQIEKQDTDSLQRSQSMRVGDKSNNMVVKSDTFSDGQSGNKRQTPSSGLRRGGKLRSTWTATSGGIPEEAEIPTTDMPNRSIGSMDEFILVGGSVNKLNPPNTLDSTLPVHFCPRAFGSTRERSNVSDVNMRTAPDSPQQVGERKLQRFAGEFIKDKRFFDQYIETEKLPTNASVQTRALASEGLDFIHDRASYWIAKEPEPQRPPPSDLGLRLMRMSTFHTNADSGLESRMSTMTSRPKSASDANDNLVSSRLSRENTSEPPQSRNQQQYVTQYHGLSTGSGGSEGQSQVQKVKVKPENET